MEALVDNDVTIAGISFNENPRRRNRGTAIVRRSEASITSFGLRAQIINTAF